MGQKRVSFKVAKAIKEAGYPQECGFWWSQDGREFSYTEDYSKQYARPTYLDVWLWLWERGIHIEILPTFAFIRNFHVATQECSNPEGGIIEAIDFLVDNDLIKNR